jgi:hypothetical protein
MAGSRPNSHIVRVRNEILVALKMIYPVALPAEQLLRSLLSVFPTLEWHQFRRDLCYLCEKGYVQRVVADSERDDRLTLWKKRWFRITAMGMEVADRLIGDPALEP